MGHRAPYIKGRGNVAPPSGYRPGQRARWLNPRPVYTHTPPPEVDLMLIGPFHLNPTLCPHDGDTLDLTTLPAGQTIFGFLPRATQDIGDPTQVAYFTLQLIDATSGHFLVGLITMNVPADLDDGSNIVEPQYGTTQMSPAALKAPTVLRVTYSANGTGPDPITQGAADIYLLSANGAP